MENIIFYSQEGCPQCKMIHMQLDKHHIEYTECQDIEKMKELDESGNLNDAKAEDIQFIEEEES